MVVKRIIELLRGPGVYHVLRDVARGLTSLPSLIFSTMQRFPGTSPEEAEAVVDIATRMRQAAEKQIGLAAGETLVDVDVPINAVFATFDLQSRRYIYDVRVEFELPGTEEIRFSTVRINSDGLLTNEELLDEFSSQFEQQLRQYAGDDFMPGTERDTILRIMPYFIVSQY